LPAASTTQDSALWNPLPKVFVRSVPALLYLATCEIEKRVPKRFALASKHIPVVSLLVVPESRVCWRTPAGLKRLILPAPTPARTSPVVS
jgi:hypothetical protein